MSYKYVIENFFTHKDFLVDPSMIPGTLYTPLHIVFEIILLSLIVIFGIFVGKRKHLIVPVFKYMWFVLIAMEAAIIAWDSVAGPVNGLDLKSSLSLYPCSIFMYVLPMIIWGKERWKRFAYGYICTLGFLGALVNLLYPYRLVDYSCISFPAMHTMLYHGAMMFAYIVVVVSKEHNYLSAIHIKDLFVPCVPSLIISIPANILNYSNIDSDYMYFKGYHPALQALMPSADCITITIILYLMYVFVPALFYLPGYLKNRSEMTAEMRRKVDAEDEEFIAEMQKFSIFHDCKKKVKKLIPKF